MSFRELQIKIGRKVKSLREGQKLTMKGLAEKSGYSTKHIYQIEHAKYGSSLRSIFDLCSVFGLTFEEFFKDIGE